MSTPVYPAPVQWTQAFSSGTAASVTTPSITITAGNIIAVCIVCEGNNIGATPVTDSKSQVYVSAVGPIVGDARCQILYFPNAAAGGTTFTFTPSANDFIGIVVIEIAEVPTSSVIGSTNSTVANSTTHSSGNITSSVDEIWIGMCGSDHSNAGQLLMTTLGFTVISQTATASIEGMIVGFRLVASGVTGQFTCTASVAHPEAALIAAFKGSSLSGSSNEPNSVFVG